MNVISLGAGVQSSAMALMAAHGEIKPMPDAAIFADTGAEPRAVYEWLDWLTDQLPFQVHKVMWKDGLQANIEASVQVGRFAGAPFYTESRSSGGGQLRRQCTREFKIQPIERKQRELLNVDKGKRVPKDQHMASWIGISLDELQRMRTSLHKWMTHRYPLIELRMSRTDCLQWMADKGYPTPPRSACVWCPYKSDHEWRSLRDTDPEGWSQALAMDELIRSGVRGTTERLFLHRSLMPLEQVDLRTAEDAGQINWLDECEGMCGI